MSLPPTSTRDAAFDIVKGLSILEVVAHHALGFSLSRFAIRGSAEWWGLFILQKVLHFAVPVFLMISALLLVRSLAKLETPNWSQFYLRRVARTVWPYILWSAFYIWFRYAFLPDRPPVAENWAVYLLWGKAEYHLYFFSVLIQVSILLPLLLSIIRWRQQPFRRFVVLAFVAQIVVFYANFLVAFLNDSHTGFLPYPASSVLWYLPPVLMGAYLGVRWNDWEQMWSRSKWTFGALALVGVLAYVSMEIWLAGGGAAESRLFNLALVTYATSMSFLMLGFAKWVATWDRTSRIIASIGNRSLGVFVIHPAVIVFLTATSFIKVFNYTPLPYLWLWGLTVMISWALVELMYVARLGRVVFGR